MILGNQKWKGAAPLFNNNDDNKIIEENLLLLNIRLEFNIIIMILNNKITEANAWVKKYFKEASVDIKLLSLIRGIKDNKLISKPIHAPSQEFDETVIRVPIIKIIKNIILEELFKIKKKRIKTFINGVWTQ